MSSATSNVEASGNRDSAGLARLLRVVLACTGLLFVVTGLTSFLQTGSSTAEKSLTTAFGIAVDSRGRVYTGIIADSAVQVYAPDGAFERIIPIAAQRGVFRLRIAEGDVLEVATVRNNMLYRFDAGGELIQSERSEDAYEEFGAANEGVAVGASGTRYVLEGRAITKVAADGSRTWLVDQGWWPWALAGNVPPLVLIAAGVVQLIVAATLRASWLHWIGAMARVRYGPWMRSQQ